MNQTHRMKVMKRNSIKYDTILCLLITLFLVVSCKDSMEIGSEVYDGIKMRVNFTSGTVQEVIPIAKAAASESNAANMTQADHAVQTQTQIIQLGDDYSVIAELVPEQELTQISTRQSTDVSGLKAAATEVRTPLPVGTQYRLLVYNENGEEVYREDHITDANSTGFEEFELSETGQYTFVAYSAGTADIPAFEGTNLSDFYVTITESQEKFMHFTQTVDIVYGINDLDAVLMNKLSEITTIIDATNIGANTLTGIVQPRFVSATYSTNVGNMATVKLLDGTMTYPGDAEDKPIVFPAIAPQGTTVVTSEPTVLVHESTSTGNLRIGYITINGLNKEINLNNISIVPGVKYDLRLRLNKGRCMINVEQEHLYVPYTPPGQTVVVSHFTFSAEANGGVVLDIVALDNSFNMIINGESLANDEIDFETTQRQTARFTDGSRHQSGGILPIWEMWGTKEAPIIRLTISPEGQVTMEGAKEAGDEANPGGGALFPMELYGTVGGAGTEPIAFNTVNWKSDGTSNEVTVTQNVINITRMDAWVGGRKIVACD